MITPLGDKPISGEMNIFFQFSYHWLKPEGISYSSLSYLWVAHQDQDLKTHEKMPAGCERWEQALLKRRPRDSVLRDHSDKIHTYAPVFEYFQFQVLLRKCGLIYEVFFFSSIDQLLLLTWNHCLYRSVVYHQEHLCGNWGDKEIFNTSRFLLARCEHV